MEIAREAVPAGITIREIRADYKKAALLGDVIVPRVACGQDKCYTVVLGSETGEIYAVVWLRAEA